MYLSSVGFCAYWSGSCFCLLRIRRPPISTRTDTRCPYTMLVRSPARKGRREARLAMLIVPHRDIPGQRLIFVVLIGIAITDDHHIGGAVVGQDIVEYQIGRAHV